MRLPIRLALLSLALLSLAPALRAQSAADTVRAQALDGGKMWLFEDPPFDYLAETYAFRPDATWFERARAASLRMPGCSASFVSPHGLVATNHHCAQSSVIAVDRGGEGLLDAGFSARSLREERPVADLYMDQLVATEDVTSEVSAAVDAAGTDAERAAALRDATAAVRDRLLQARGVDTATYDDAAADLVVQVVGLYNGGRYSAYVFRRFRDVRLVMAPEARLGYFGGDYDNFTYPRYAADFAFFRVYERGAPYQPAAHFPLSTTGVAADSVVFVIGNPGSTSRGLTVAELEYLRDVQLPSQLAFLDSRAAALQRYLASGEAPNPDAVRGQLFGLRNSQKAVGGRLQGLRDPYILARRAAAERDFRAASAEAGTLVDRQAAIQAERRALAPQVRAFSTLFNTRNGSALLRRALSVAQGNAAAAGEIASPPPPVERAYLAAELDALRTYYAEAGRVLPAALRGATALDAADALMSTSAVASAEDAPSATASDPAVALVGGLLPDLASYSLASQSLAARQTEVARQLGRERYRTYGSAVPPDATFSLRFTDGVVRGYPYNGTTAPPVTTTFGLFDRHHSFCGDPAEACDWRLPERWLAAEPALDLATPINFTSTSDTIGGNSGSPVVNRNLELVGLNFDRTIEGLVRDYLYAPERGRNVMVDGRFILEALRSVYKLDGLADELVSGRRPR